MSKSTMKQANVRFNYQDYLQLPEDRRYEILDGELYLVPAPNIKHQRVAIRLQNALFMYVQSHDLGELLAAPCDVLLSDENVVQPDILFISKGRLDVMGSAYVSAGPDLVVEILSPGTWQKDLELKRKIYARFEVREYWIVDPDADTVEILIRQEGDYISAATCHKSDSLSSPLLPGLDLRLSEVFP